ncbi:MAG: TIGR01777 family oxidoreductase, partial [Thermoplasmata archaeon]|nr:TIGR01777 family oxidoreductase [Thermoplasmata archaeon]
MRIVVTGATGLIGRALVSAAQARGDTVVALSRDVGRASEILGSGIEAHAWPDPTSEPPPEAALAGADAVVNLMGEQIAQRWTEESKRRIRDSRVLGTRSLVEGLRALADAERPQTLVSQSAVGFYGAAGDQQLDEQAPAGSGFLAELVVAWEREAQSAAPMTRVVVTRTGVVLASAGGALAKMLPFFRLGIGGPVAGGRQYVAWIHLDDVVGGLLFCVDHREAHGPVNLTAPTPAT